MASKKLTRTTYVNPVTGLIRTGDTTRAECQVDTTQFEHPLEQIHGSGLHGWGVGAGLRVTVTLGQPNVRTQAGIALDSNGRHISLAEGGKAEKGPNADNPGVLPDLTEVLASSAPLPGAELPTAGLTGSHYLTISWRETFDADLWNSSSQTIFQVNHTPWLKLFPVAGFSNDGSRVVLARVDLDAGSNVVGLSHEGRLQASLPVGSVQLRRGHIAAGVVDNVASGEIRPRPAGGIEIRVPDAGDQIHLTREGGNFAKLVVGADQIVLRRGDLKESVLIDTTTGKMTVGTSGIAGEVLVKDGANRPTITLDGANANLVVGTEGNEGDVLVKDARNRLVITLDGDDAAIVVGAAGNEGDILVKDSEGQTSVRIDGAPGDIEFRGRLRDPNGSHGGIGHNFLRHLPELTGGGFTALHRHLNSGNATRSRVRWLSADNSTAIEKVDFGSPRRLSAFISLSAMDPRHDFDRGDGFFAEIYRVDDRDDLARANGWFFGGDHLGPDGADENMRSPFWVGVARSVTFRLRSVQDATIWAVGVVFPEE